MFAVVYGALLIANVFPSRRVNGLIAAVFAIFGVSYAPAVEFINQVLPIAMIFFIIFFFVGFVIKVAKSGLEDKQGKKDYTLLIIIMGLVLLLFATQGPGFIDSFLPGFEEQANNIMVISVIVFIGVILLAAYKLSIKEKPI
jgi:hypothetical protein